MEWNFISKQKDELHIGLDVPKQAATEIYNWVQEQKWPKGTELEALEDYHITLLFAQEGGAKEHLDDDWITHDSHAVSITGIKEFPPSEEKGGLHPIVLLVESETAKAHHNNLADGAEEAGIEISQYSRDKFKPHLTIAYGPSLPKDIKYPEMTFESEQSSVSEPREEDGPEEKKGHLAPYMAELVRFSADSWNPSTQWPGHNETEIGRFPAQGCTCEDGDKLNCPVHGLEATHPAYEHMWDIRDLGPAGKPAELPRKWMQAQSTTYDWEDDYVPEGYFHAAPTEDRARIFQHGLQPSAPIHNPAWNKYHKDFDFATQPTGVYVGEDPDTTMSYQPQMDVWHIDPNYIREILQDPHHKAWSVIPHELPPEALVLHEPYEKKVEWPVKNGESPFDRWQREYNEQHGYLIPQEWKIGQPTSSWKIKESGSLTKPQKCKKCKNPAVKTLLWAEGKAYIPVCEKHEEKERKRLENENELCAVHDIKESKQAADEYDTREFSDSLQFPPQIEAPRAAPHAINKHCTCKDGDKLNCPLHGLEPTEEDPGLSWSIPEGSPVGWAESLQQRTRPPNTAAHVPIRDIIVNEVKNPAWVGTDINHGSRRPFFYWPHTGEIDLGDEGATHEHLFNRDKFHDLGQDYAQGGLYTKPSGEKIAEFYDMPGPSNYVDHMQAVGNVLGAHQIQFNEWHPGGEAMQNPEMHWNFNSKRYLADRKIAVSVVHVDHPDDPLGVHPNYDDPTQLDRPLLYHRDTNTAYVGKPGGYHSDLMQSIPYPHNTSYDDMAYGRLKQPYKYFNPLTDETEDYPGNVSWVGIPPDNYLDIRDALHTQEDPRWKFAKTIKDKSGKLWLDDSRRPPSGDWDWARNVDDAIRKTKIHDYEHMSLDHDLGMTYYKKKVIVNPDALSGGDFALWLHEHGDKKRMPKSVELHSHNERTIDLMKKILEPHCKVTIKRAPDHLEEDWAKEYKVHLPSEIKKEEEELPTSYKKMNPKLTGLTPTEYTGHPEIDRLIDEFKHEGPLSNWLTGKPIDVAKMESPRDSYNKCNIISWHFNDWMKRHGYDAPKVKINAHGAYPNWENASKKEPFGNRHYVNIINTSNGPHMIDWSASQYGQNAQFPEVRKLPNTAPDWKDPYDQDPHNLENKAWKLLYSNIQDDITWQPGQLGKWVLDERNRLHAWPVNNQGSPHHFDIFHPDLINAAGHIGAHGGIWTSYGDLSLQDRIALSDRIAREHPDLFEAPENSPEYQWHFANKPPKPPNLRKGDIKGHHCGNSKNSDTPPLPPNLRDIKGRKITKKEAQAYGEK